MFTTDHGQLATDIKGTENTDRITRTQVSSMKKESRTREIILVNMNVWFGMDARGYLRFGELESDAKRKARFKLLTDGLKNIRPDVIAIQEANMLPGYAKKLAREIGYDAVWKTTNSGIKVLGWGIPKNFAAGNAILAPRGCGLRLIGAERISGRGLQSKYFSFHIKELRDVIAALAIIRGQPIIVFNTQTHFSVICAPKWQKALNHWIDSYQMEAAAKENLLQKLHKGQNRREEEISRIIAFVKRITKIYDYPFMIIGDFNTTADTTEIINLIAELDLRDTYRIKNPDKKGYTWDPAINTNTEFDASLFWADGITPKDPLNMLEAQFDGNIARRIDFVFLSYQFEPNMIKEVRLIFNTPTDGLFASDHFGIQVVLNRLPS
jgi:endonuclease/exonuclease/phosphatase family metal-dependent hydrolase